MKDVYLLSKQDVKVIKSSLNAHLKQCKHFLKNDSSLTVLDRVNLEEKIELIEELIQNM